MNREDRMVRDLILWDMISNRDMFGKQEPEGCTPYIVSAILLGSVLSSMSEIGETIILQLKYIALVGVAFSVVTPIAERIKSRSLEVGISDFIYVVLIFFNAIVGTATGYGVVCYFLQKINIKPEGILTHLTFYIIGFFWVRAVQNIVWNILHKKNI